MAGLPPPPSSLPPLSPSLVRTWMALDRGTLATRSVGGLSLCARCAFLWSFKVGAQEELGVTETLFVPFCLSFARLWVTSYSHVSRIAFDRSDNTNVVHRDVPDGRYRLEEVGGDVHRVQFPGFPSSFPCWLASVV